jgi:predicted GIY-YIG superfamily endonuclease
MSQHTPPTSLYRMYDSSQRLLYVGITSRGPRRWREHMASKAWWDEVATVSVEHFPLRSDAASAEQWAIRNERPLYNVAHAGSVSGCCGESHPPLDPRFDDATHYDLLGIATAQAQMVHTYSRVFSGRDFCANTVWYAFSRDQLMMVVGWEAGATCDFSRTPEAYDVAYGWLYRQLPDCVHPAELMCGPFDGDRQRLCPNPVDQLMAVL